eukprot:TRINITY_DN28326_c0_g1_i1.p1 TRINITY_DN28326_c0_g1~~TRINITY_DN28326_c0_g1_i1.p1  ORF type:complete len:157 (-),score=49.01 TRINITY_DN28326_c0_g1_i1:8-454(-)
MGVSCKNTMDRDANIDSQGEQDQEPEQLADSGSEPDSLFGEEDDQSEACLMATPTTPGVAPLNFSHLLQSGQSRRPHSSMGLAATLGLDELSLPPKGPLVRTQRQRTISTSATISTEREPIIRISKRTIYTAGRPPWYDSQGQQVEPL